MSLYTPGMELCFGHASFPFGADSSGASHYSMSSCHSKKHGKESICIQSYPESSERFTVQSCISSHYLLLVCALVGPNWRKGSAMNFSQEHKKCINFRLPSLC